MGETMCEPMKSLILAVALAAHLAAPAVAQVRPGDLLFTTPPNGNTVSAYRPDGTLLGQSDGPPGAWWVGQALLPDLGWVTLSLDIQAMPPGWRLLRFDRSGVQISSTYLTQPAELSDMARTADDLLLLTDGSRGRVHRYTLDGTFVDFIDFVGTGISPHRACALADGTFWIFDTGIRAFGNQPAVGRHFSATGQPIGSVTFPVDILKIDALDDGTFWATQSYNRRVRHFDASGNVFEAFNSTLGQTSAGQLRVPWAIAVARDGSVWLSHAFTEQITRLDATGTTLEFFIADIDGFAPLYLDVVAEAEFLGARYCDSTVNSTGSVAILDAFGSLDVLENALTLRAYDLPRQSFGFLLASRTQGNVPQPGGSQGILCVGGSIGRYVGPGQIQNSGALGTLLFPVDLAQIPTPTGFVGGMAGEQWSFQAWFRDANPSATSNFTTGVAVTLE